MPRNAIPSRLIAGRGEAVAGRLPLLRPFLALVPLLEASLPVLVWSLLLVADELDWSLGLLLLVLGCELCDELGCELCDELGCELCCEEVACEPDEFEEPLWPLLLWVWAAAQRAQLSRTANIVNFVLMDTSARWFAILEKLVSRLTGQEEIGETG